MNALGTALIHNLDRTATAILAQLDGIPEDALNHWKPSPSVISGEVSTFYGLASHVVESGRYWIVVLAGNNPTQRDRLRAFRAFGTLDELREQYRHWLLDAREVINRLTEEELAESFVIEGDPAQGYQTMQVTRGQCIVHALEHAAIHLGHLQLQRQLWERHVRTLTNT